VRSANAASAPKAPAPFADRPLLASYTRRDVDDLVRDHPDGAALRRWITDARRQILAGTAAAWWSSREREDSRFGVKAHEIDRLAVEFNQLGVAYVRIEGDRMTFQHV
jgi:hypothetical protein